MNTDLGNIIIIRRRCHQGLLEFWLVLHFVIIATNNGDEEGFISKGFEKITQNRTINIVVAYLVHCFKIWQDVLPPLAKCTRIRYDTLNSTTIGIAQENEKKKIVAK